jgi:competence/damage-inducible protein cinA C-terminal domain
MDPYIISDLQEIAPDLLDALRQAGLKIATAESCTGGNIAHHLTLVAGCSDVYMGGAVTYSNEAKADILGVDQAVIEAEGAVSEPVVRAMAEGACRRFHTQCAVATSGIAGPSGGTDDKPVGTVWTAVVTPRGTFSELYHLAGPRSEIIDKATLLVLRLLLNHL